MPLFPRLILSLAICINSLKNLKESVSREVRNDMLGNAWEWVNDWYSLEQLFIFSGARC